jgi:hypothetical protein
MKTLSRLAARACLAIGLLSVVAAGPAWAAAGDKARISGLNDVAFGAIANLSIDQRSGQSLCLYTSSAGGGYSITATGSGAGGAFTLASGGSTLAYEVEWADSPGLSTGSALSAGSPLSGQVSPASNQNCSPAPATTASLIVVLRAAALGSATTGAYSGTLTLLVAPL